MVRKVLGSSWNMSESISRSILHHKKWVWILESGKKIGRNFHLGGRYFHLGGAEIKQKKLENTKSSKKMAQNVLGSSWNIVESIPRSISHHKKLVWGVYVIICVFFDFFLCFSFEKHMFFQKHMIFQRKNKGKNRKTQK